MSLLKSFDMSLLISLLPFLSFTISNLIIDPPHSLRLLLLPPFLFSTSKSLFHSILFIYFLLFCYLKLLLIYFEIILCFSPLILSFVLPLFNLL